MEKRAGNPVEIDIISGFLGAGKTTLIQKLVEERLFQERTAIIENEFGSISIDSGRLRKTNVRVLDIHAGCICCSQESSFADAIPEIIRTFRPDRILVEPSGVAILSDVIKACAQAGRNTAIGMIVAVINARRFDAFAENFNGFFENQVEHAKTILLSRTKGLPLSKVSEIVSRIHSRNPKTVVITAPWEELTADCILTAARYENAQEAAKSLLSQRGSAHTRTQTDRACRATEAEHGPHTHPAESLFDSFGLQTARPFTLPELKTALGSLGEPAYGAVLRAKGSVPCSETEWLSFDYVCGDIEIRKTASEACGRVCVIGTKLAPAALTALFEGDCVSSV